jgi:hypothetical protein
LEGLSDSCEAEEPVSKQLKGTLQAMNAFRNEKGIALITALMLTTITLVIALTLLYMITQGVQMTGAGKRYQNVREASYGGVEVLTKDVIPLIFNGYSSVTSLNTQLAKLNTDGQLVTSIARNGYSCLGQKLMLPSAQWNANCRDNNYNPTVAPDLAFNLSSANAGQPYRVYAKIVDTQQRVFYLPDGSKTIIAGNTEASGLMLEGGAVTEANQVISPKHFPYIYRIEVQGQKATNAIEQANVSVLYAY